MHEQDEGDVNVNEDGNRGEGFEEILVLFP